MHIRYTVRSILVFSFLLLCTHVFAQGKGFVQLKNGRVSFSKTAVQTLLDSFRHQAAQQPLQIIVKLKQPTTGDVRKELAISGITLAEYIGDNTYSALLDSKGNEENNALLEAIAVMPAGLKWTGGQFPAGERMIDVTISLMPGMDKAAFTALVKASGGSLKISALESYGQYELSLPAKNILLFAANPFIKTIGNAARDVPLNLESQGATKANIAHAANSLGGYGLLGDGITIGVGDNTSGVNHADLRDRIINFNPATYTNHGQHINGIVGGAGNLNPAAEGFAPHARILDHLYNLVWARTGTMLQDYGMSVTNNSYASIVGDCGFAGTYDAYAQVLDSITRQFPSVLHVFAAGNDGNLTCGPYPIGYATVTGGYQPSKNVLVVANIDKRYVPSYNSSHGPVKDGRLKPEIAAIGTDVLSTRGVDIYLVASGTSMASPQVTGTAALLQQRYKILHAGQYPQADLLKCILMNGATDMGNPGPDYIFGFGMLNAVRSLSIMDNNRFSLGSIAANATQTSTITVPANTAQLKVMLYWHDVPASPIAVNALVNDLDLEVTEPGSTLHRPYVLNPSPAHVADNAVEGADHLNNVEQVVINNPAAGSYVVNVKSGSLSGGNQGYALTYDFIADSVRLTYPFNGSLVKANDSLRAYWDASNGTAPFTLELSTNGSATWNVLSNAIPANQRYYTILAPNIASEQCRMRLTRGSQQSTSGNFVMNPQTVLTLNAIQCPGYMNLQWTAVPNATGYQVLRKIGPFMQPEAIVTGTSYNISGLSPDSIYYAAVQPIINGLPGYRSLGVKRQPNDGTCAGSFSDGDLSIQQFLAPQTGRQSTSTALTAAENLTLLISNHDDAPATSYRISYRVNGGAWQSTNFSIPIPANSATTITIPGLNLSTAGSYIINAAITNLAIADPVSSNDSVVRVVRQLLNPSLNLAGGVLDDFEANSAFTVMHDSIGVTTNDRWDYLNSSDSGRLRSFVSSDITISGSRSISMDASLTYQQIANFFTGTFNAAAYNTSNAEVRMQFDYKLHGHPRLRDSNTVWVRGSDAQLWKVVMRYDTAANPGVIVHSGSLSLTDALLAAGQNFSSSMQVRFGQYDSSVIALNDYGSGLTIDNVKLYTVQNDVGITDVITPKGSGCNMTASTPFTVRLYNGVTNTVNGISISYQLDGAAAVTETIASIPGKTAQLYSFTHLLNAAAPGLHTLKIWIAAPGDTYAANDSILNYTFRNEPLIVTYPYLQNFENGDGYFYAEGLNSSWAFGTPASSGVRHAASGSKAWKTNLTGNYNDNERSYLYSPCFDIAALSKPMLSFSAVISVEDCGSILCDAAWVEYSLDGGTNWTKLGAKGQGYNWYTDSALNIWKTQGDNRWHVASIPLPTASSLRIRFVLSSDGGTGVEGLAIDDVHIYDKAFPIYEGGDTGPVNASTGNVQWTPFLKNGAAIAATKALAQTSTATEAQLYSHSNLVDASTNKYFAPRSYTLKLANPVSDSISARLYIPDSEILIYLNDTTCKTCSKAEDAYRLGVLKYDDGDKSIENGMMADNQHGIYNFIPYSRIAWVPYDRGYYAQLTVPSFSEFWFYDSGPSIALPPPSTAVSFDAKKMSGETVLTQWTTIIDTLVATYNVERSDDNNSSFHTIHTVAGALRPTPAQFSYVDTPGAVIGKHLYYRLRWVLLDGSAFYSPVKEIIWTAPNTLNAVYPNPVENGQLFLQWSANAGTVLRTMITDVSGKLLRDISATATDWNNNLAIDMGGVARGIYFLHTTIGGNSFTNKIVVR